MPSKSRQRHLAKRAESRRQERQRAARRRTVALSVGGAIAGILVIALGVTILNRHDTNAAAASPTPAPSASVPAAASTPKPQFDHAPSPNQVLDKNMEYSAVLHTSCGDITIELDSSAAPQTVASFVFLAEHKFFDGTFFHRVVE